MGLARDLRGVAIFAPCYVALDWASYIAPLGVFNITPWNPQAALAVAWLLVGGTRLAPIVGGTIFGADLIVRGAPAGVAITMLTAAVLALGYAAIAWTLRMPGRMDPALRTTRDLTVLVGVAAVGTGVVGASFVGILSGTRLLGTDSFAEGWLRFWIGDAVGILVTAPLMLVAADPERRQSLLALARRPETIVQVIALIATAWLIFVGLGGDPSRHFYLFFLPLIWIAARGGMSGAVVAAGIVQLGVVIGIHRDPVAELPVVELQALVAALTLSALFLGMVVDERQRANRELEHSLRLAAAGEMAGAIAHEMNQPLTALANYGRSALMLLERDPGSSQPLPEIINRMLAEAERASEVVRRLRDFFRTGTTRLETLTAVDLAGLARRVGGQVIEGTATAYDVRCESGLPDVLADRLQLELVLRNLIANAADAVRNREGQRIGVAIGRRDAGHLRIAVLDSGPGVPAAAREHVFEPFVSGKPSGMGLGLAVSRAIAEAHGGTLVARAGHSGEFHLILPFVTDDAH